MSDHIVSAVTELVEQVTDVPADELSASSRFTELGNWTSFAALRLLTAVEDRFAIRIDLREYLATSDVGGLAAIITAAPAR